jgi:predicted RNA-binding Zn-ribbon protein involved in translation (DUF1610 family)
MKLTTIIGGVIAAICFFFAVIFAMAASYSAAVATSRLLTSGILFLVGAAVLAVVWYMNRKNTTIVQRLEVSGQMKAATIKCPNCGGNIAANQIQINQGVPYAKCPYCGTTFEVTEEPKW